MTSIDYQISFERYTKHLVDVAIHFVAKNKAPILWLPSWLAGSYLMREFARNITAVYYQVNGKTHKADKISKNEWQLTQATKGDTLIINYEVYCYDLSVRTAYVDNTRIFGNFSSLALAVTGQEKSAVTVTLSVPHQFYSDKNYSDKREVKIACGLTTEEKRHNNQHLYMMQAPSYDELIDYPFEVAQQNEFTFKTQDRHGQFIQHRFFISGHIYGLGVVNTQRLSQDIHRICQTYNTWLGDTPFDDYTFMTFASGNDYGGLEHINSTALVTPRDDLPSFLEGDEPSDNYQRFLGLCSHEYFHAWWVKTVRPDVMMDVDLRVEAYTPLLWVFEGFTSYIDDFMLQASGVISKTSYLKLLSAQINRYHQTLGRHHQSVAESSFDAWIKLYRADENTANAGISYYNKGALVALCLDLLMLEQTDGQYRLFDVVKHFYEKAKQNEQKMGSKRFGMNDTNLAEVMSEFISLDVWQDFYHSYVIGLKPLPFKQLFANHGVSMIDNLSSNTQAWGMMVTESAHGLVINKINRDSVASEAGLSAKDVIVAIDGIKASKKQLDKVAFAQVQLPSTLKQSVICHVFRRDELMIFEVAGQTKSGVTALPSLDKVTLSLTTLDEVAWDQVTWLSPKLA